MSLKTFLSSIGHFFTDLFSGIQKVWHSLTEAEQAVSIKASSIIAIINANLTAAPADVLSLIQAAFPTMTKEGLTDLLNKANQILGIADNAASGTFEQALQTLQAYLSKYQGNTWITITRAVVEILVTVLEPGTIIQKIETVLEYVYQEFVKPKTQTTTSS